ncbi:MAG: biotin transporter BioY, partial [Tomitella sp.]|nr:biotin transporter BioY [Tomitella sp.]
LIGWIPAALVIGLLTSRMMPNYRLPTGFAINIAGGIVVMYLFGITGMLLRTDMGAGAAVLANVAFIPGDVVKAIITAAVAAQVHRAYPGVIPARRRRREPVPSAG